MSQASVVSEGALLLTANHQYHKDDHLMKRHRCWKRRASDAIVTVPSAGTMLCKLIIRPISISKLISNLITNLISVILVCKKIKSDSRTQWTVSLSSLLSLSLSLFLSLSSPASPVPAPTVAPVHVHQSIVHRADQGTPQGWRWPHGSAPLALPVAGEWVQRRRGSHWWGWKDGKMVIWRKSGWPSK